MCIRDRGSSSESEGGNLLPKIAKSTGGKRQNFLEEEDIPLAEFWLLFVAVLFYYKNVLIGLPLLKMPNHRKMALGYSINRNKSALNMQLLRACYKYPFFIVRLHVSWIYGEIFSWCCQFRCHWQCCVMSTRCKKRMLYYINGSYSYFSSIRVSRHNSANSDSSDQ